MKMILLCLALVLPMANKAQAQQPPVPVHVLSTTDDPTGTQLLYHYRERLRASQGMNLVGTREESLIRVKFVTLDPSNGENGLTTVYSLVLTVRQFDRDADVYWTHFVGICPQRETVQCADSLAAQTDKVATEYIAVMRSTETP